MGDCVRQNVDAFKLENIKFRNCSGDMRSENADCKREAAANGGGHFRMAWFRIYRWLKWYFWNQPAQSNVEYASWYEEFSAHRITFVTSFGAIVVALVLHVILPADLSEPPFAILGCALLSLVVNGRWGTIAAIFYCVMVLVVKIYFHIEPVSMAVLLWNFFMRFLLLEIYVVLFDIVRRQASSLPER